MSLILGLARSIPAFNNIRGALVFSSGHVSGQKSHMTGRPPPPAVTPLAPRLVILWKPTQIALFIRIYGILYSFGVLPCDTPVEPGSSTHLLHSPNKLLDFSRMTPSPSPSPVATNKLSFTPAPVSQYM